METGIYWLVLAAIGGIVALAGWLFGFKAALVITLIWLMVWTSS